MHGSFKWWIIHLNSCWSYDFILCINDPIEKMILNPFALRGFMTLIKMIHWNESWIVICFYIIFSYLLYHNHSFSSNNCLWTWKSRDIFFSVGQYPSFTLILKSIFDRDFCFFSCVLFCDMVWYWILNSDMNCFNFLFSITKAYILFNLSFNSWYPIYSNPSIVCFELF